MSDHNDLIPNYNFVVKLDGITVGFAKVSNMSSSAEIDTIVNGGHNDEPVIFVKPKKSPDMLVFERGTRTSLTDTMLSLLKAGKKIESLMIMVKRNGKTTRIYSASNCVVVRKELAPLDAMGNSVFLEALQVAHTGLTELALPIAF